MIGGGENIKGTFLETKDIRAGLCADGVDPVETKKLMMPGQG